MALILVGGFLGSGKTTAIVKACRLLMDRGNTVAVITNDQGTQQVDGLLVNSLTIKNQMVANGCFCCQYNELNAQLDSLNVNKTDYIFAESVGSCTDLIATVVKPLNKFKPRLQVFLCVFVDAGLVASIIEGRNHFEDESVRYIFKKQLEEADLLVVNKIDTISDMQLAKVKEVIESDIHGISIRYQNSNDISQVRDWVDQMENLNIPQARQSLNIDYKKYGDGERKMAWFDQTIRIETQLGNAHFIGREIIQSLVNRTMQERLFIGHLKFFLKTNTWSTKISFTSTSTSANFKIRNEETNFIEILVNARVQTEPEYLKNIVQQAINTIAPNYNCRIDLGNEASFKPGFPQPTHRLR